MIGRTIKSHYLHSLLCLKTDLWLKNNPSHRPTFLKLLLHSSGVVCVCGLTYIYRGRATMLP